MKKFYFCQFALLLFANFNVVRTSDLQCADPSDFLCLNGKKCIPRLFVCNDMDECGDGSDEVHCNDMFGDAESNPLIKTQCSTNQFRCGDGVCVPKSAVCDGRNNCRDNSDELHCKRPNQECKGFECGNLCIPMEYVCDGEPDCNDGLDELNCGPDAFMNHTCLIEHGFFPCKGSRSRCIPIRRVCDGYVDCEHGTDENGLCNKTSCNGFRCEHGCTQTPEGPHCLCPLGFRADNTKCIDIDECEIDPPRCSQSCTNMPGSYKCSCLPGYTLHDNRSCVANKSEPVLLLTTMSEASALYIRSRLFVKIYSMVNNPQSIDMDNEQGYVYWTESLSDGAGIVRSTINGHGLERVVASGIHQPEALVVDWVGRHVYFTDSYFKHIVVCDITGLYCATVVAKGLDRPRGIAVEPESRLMFWTDVSETQPHIGRSGMDGSNPVRIVRTELSQPSSVAVDPIVKRIFWCDSGLDRLESSSFDGTSRRLIHSLVSHPMSVDVFEDWLYWSDPKEHQVKRCNKFNGKHVEVLMSEYGLSPLGIRVAHPIRQMQQINSACWGVVCSHLCLLSSTSPTNYTCACPADMSLGPDGKTCQRDNKMTSLVVATATELFQLHPYQIGREMTHRLPPHLLENIGAVAYDQRTHSLVYSDIGARVIYRLDLASYNQSTLFSGIDAVEGLDVDDYSGSIYWTDAGRGTVVMASPVTGKLLVLARGLVHPGALVLAIERGEIYIAEGRSNAVIRQWTTDGVFQRNLVEDIGSVSSMAYDRDSNILYWSDIQKGSISCIDVTSGTQRKVKGHIGLPVALGVSNLHLYWILQHSDRLYWTDKTSYKAIRSKQIDSAETREVSYTKMAVVEPHFSRPANYSYPCLNNGGCSHFCTPSPSGPVCLCPSGMALSEDRKACHLLVNCNADFFRCPDGKCIPESQVCDGIPDCQPPAADEMNCSANKTGPCSPKEFRCGSGECVPLDFRCDLEFDCKDKSDEPSDCPTVRCKPFEEFSCKNQRQCIPALSHCDGESDCKDGSDEIGCLRGHDCRHDEFFCPQSKLCVSRAWRCDGSEDCEHGEDEFNCTVAVDSCPANFVRCKANEPCLPRVMLCNGVANCLHESPEQLCRSLEKPANHSVATGKEADACPSGQFSCFMSWGECLPSSAKCNCVKECPRGEDEEGCPPCTSDRFKCPDENRYIETSWLCDGEADCSSGADELPGLCVKNVTEDEEPFPGIDIFVGQACSSDDFTCKNGVCVSYKVLCDGHNDCIDNTDEGRSCSNACENNGGCPHLCQKSPEGPICHCHPGYKSLDSGRQCIDINECEVDDDCAQICVNTKGSRKCACAPGYHLQADSRSCKAAEGRPFFVLSGIKSFERLLIESAPFAASANSHLKWTHSEQPVKDFDFTVRNSTLYWISTHSTLYASHSYNPGQALHKFSHFRASSLAVDFVTGNLYVAGAADNGQSQIRVWSPAAGHEAVVYRTTGVVTDVALDPSRGLLFWAEVAQGTGRIRRSAMDGTDVQALSNSRKIVNPASLAVDPVKGRVYWADVHTKTISSCDFDGSRYRVDVKNTYGMPLSLTFFENRLYWTCSDQKVVQVASIGEHAVEEVAIDLAAHHILAVHSVLEPTLVNPCAETECGNGLCVLTANSTQNCLCPGDWKIESVHPFRCRNSSLCPLQCNLDQKCVSVDFEWRCEPVDNTRNLPEDSVEIPSSPGVTAASIFICLAILTVLAIAVCVYYRRCRTSVGSPLKLRFRNALGLNEESIAWDESVDYSDRKALHKKESLEPPHEVQVHDSNRNTLTAPPDSAYASQQSLARAGSTEGIAHGLQVSFPLRQKLLASEL